MVEYKIADESLAEKGKEALTIDENKMPVTDQVIRDRFAKENT